MNLKNFTEQSLIELFKNAASQGDPEVICGIGDDAAVLRLGSRNLLLTTDALREGIHFNWDWTPPFLLGRKSLAVNLSDLAAMGGKGRFALLGLAVPPKESPKRLREFQAGFQSMAQEFGVTLIGGDTDRSAAGWQIQVTLIGECASAVYRSGALPSDQIWVTGNLGYSARGLELLKSSPKIAHNVLQNSSKAFKKLFPKEADFLRRHLDPIPQIQAGLLLAKQKLTTAMMDLSDGLLIDLERLCTASGVSARIFRSCLPQEVEEELVCTGGEDYELLFTASPHAEKKILRLFSKINVPVRQIGEIIPNSRVRVCVVDEGGKVLKFSRKGFEHF